MARPRLHDDRTATALLDAAERIVATEGLDALTVRRVAAVVGTTTRSVYSTHGSKEALLGALGRRAFDMLGAVVAALPLTDDPRADLVRAGAEGFRGFVLAHPALFRVGVQQSWVPADVRGEIAPAAARALKALHERLRRVEAAGGLGDRSLAEATVAFHALCEGMASLELRGLPPERAEPLWHDALTTLVAGWTAGQARRATTA